MSERAGEARLTVEGQTAVEIIRAVALDRRRRGTEANDKARLVFGHGSQQEISALHGTRDSLYRDADALSSFADHAERCIAAVGWLEAHGWSEIDGVTVYGVRHTGDVLASIEHAMDCPECVRLSTPCPAHGLDSLAATSTPNAEVSP